MSYRTNAMYSLAVRMVDVESHVVVTTEGFDGSPEWTIQNRLLDLMRKEHKTYGEGSPAFSCLWIVSTFRVNGGSYLTYLFMIMDIQS